MTETVEGWVRGGRMSCALTHHILSLRTMSIYLQIWSLLQAPCHWDLSIQQLCTTQRSLQNSSDVVYHINLHCRWQPFALCWKCWWPSKQGTVPSDQPLVIQHRSLLSDATYTRTRSVACFSYHVFTAASNSRSRTCELLSVPSFRGYSYTRESPSTSSQILYV